MPESSRSEVRLIKYKTIDIDLPDDPSYPFKLYIDIQLPKLIKYILNLLHGILLHDENEEIVFRGMTKESLEKVIELLELRTDPYLRHFTITGPDGIVERFSNDN